MKTFFTIISFWTIFMGCFAQTNVYFPLPSSNVMWREQEAGYQGGACLDYQYLITGDTVISGKTYHKLQESGASYHQDPQGICMFNPYYLNSYYNHYRGAFRNDSVNKKVYFLDADSINEILLYDFSLNLYDTLPYSYGNIPQIVLPVCVASIDSILIGDKYHKRFGVGNCPTFPFGESFAYLIEGIGFTYGLLAYFIPNFEYSHLLLCFQQNGMTVYPDTNYSCSIVTGLTHPLINEIHFQINPNPLINGSTAQINTNIKNVSLQILDVYGRIINKYYSLNDKSILELSKLNSGLYLYQVYRDNHFLKEGKLIIIN